jgi:hypothetical protein
MGVAIMLLLLVFGGVMAFRALSRSSSALAESADAARNEVLAVFEQKLRERGLQPAETFVSIYNHAGISIDPSTRIVGICGKKNGTLNVEIFNPRQILGVKLAIDGLMDYRPATGDIALRSAVGELVAGEGGAIAGALSAVTHARARVRSIVLKVHVDDVLDPERSITLVATSNGAFVSGEIAQAVLSIHGHPEKWVQRLETLVAAESR